ncbi:CheY-P phosphatase CheX [Oxobacter pfennigii]|uniref:CheY-P phosphatase CheX n=1 Tax=Oxobacter pfennigii TaxID=36849 RepID=A0A0P8WML2_9CLOT|nr:chemotaxis protein CheX [Oxobacter pfennigii]KPU43738.1 CheY-P phosphatase CheX [Oxobacter pfennigii]
MKVENINPFIQASVSILKALCNVDVSLGKVYVKNHPYQAEQINIIVGVVGDIKGQVCFELSKDTAKNIASAMMGGMMIAELDEISKSAISEMGNMIMGNACSVFGDKSVHIDITPPYLMTGENIEISNKLPTVAIPLTLEASGTMTINVTMG